MLEQIEVRIREIIEKGANDGVTDELLEELETLLNLKKFLEK